MTPTALETPTSLEVPGLPLPVDLHTVEPHDSFRYGPTDVIPSSQVLAVVQRAIGFEHDRAVAERNGPRAGYLGDVGALIDSVLANGESLYLDPTLAPVVNQALKDFAERGEGRDPYFRATAQGVLDGVIRPTEHIYTRGRAEDHDSPSVLVVKPPMSKEDKEFRRIEDQAVVLMHALEPYEQTLPEDQLLPLSLMGAKRKVKERLYGALMRGKGEGMPTLEELPRFTADEQTVVIQALKRAFSLDSASMDAREAQTMAQQYNEILKSASETGGALFDFRELVSSQVPLAVRTGAARRPRHSGRQHSVHEHFAARVRRLVTPRWRSHDS